MRIVAFLLSILVSSALLIGGGFLLAVGSPDDAGDAWIVIASMALAIVLYGALILGFFRAYWDVDGSDEARRYRHRMLVVILGLEIVAAITLVGGAVLVSARPFVPIVSVGGGVALTAAALVLGPIVHRRDRARRPVAPSWEGISAKEIRTRVVAVTATSVGVLLIGIAGFSVLGPVTSKDFDVTDILFYAVDLACLAAAIVGVFSSMGWLRRLRDVAGRDPGRVRRIASVVVRKKSLELSDRDQVAAARYASVVSVTMPFQLLYLVLLYTGIGLQQVRDFSDGSGDGFGLILVIAFVVILAVLVPLQIVRIRRARRYLDAHSDFLEADMAAAV